MAKGDRLYQKALALANQEHANLAEVYHLLMRSCAVGNSKAKYAVGSWHLHGKFVERNLAKAVSFLRESADGGVAAAHYDLAVCYETGQGVKKSLKQAFFHYQIASVLGDKQAVYALGRCFYYGIGTTVRKELGSALCEIAENDISTKSE